MLNAQMLAGWGSSPLARGTQFYAGPVIDVIGLIPARAGNTHRRGDSFPLEGAHPRSRGEHLLVSSTRLFAVGSSPLARGTPKADSAVDGVQGLIPARAGNTGEAGRTEGADGAHPRSRGEHIAYEASQGHQAGSSPLARGTHTPLNRQSRTPGLIPARAGNTPPHQVQDQEPGAHPRSRGEHLALVIISDSALGSSPLARGTLPYYHWSAFFGGLIPARAGNTGTPSQPTTPCRAHPRSRGEHSRSASKKCCRSGSSPLARGTRWLFGFSTCWKGLIPARAGNTPKSQQTGKLARAHPRSRGEHAGGWVVGRLAAGSSPLARGTRLLASASCCACGLIPARAGNTRY